MEMKTNTIQKILKNLCYIFTPILVAVLLGSIVLEIMTNNNSEIALVDNYYESNLFSKRYFERLKTKIGDLERAQNSVFYSKNNNLNKNIYYYDTYNDCENFQYLIIDKTRDIAITNVETYYNNDNLELIKKEIKKSNIYWTLENGRIDTSIEKLNEKNIEKEDLIFDKNGVYVYTSINEKLPYMDNIYRDFIAYTSYSKIGKYNQINIPLISIMLIGIFIIIVKSIGKNKNSGENEIKLNIIDKIPLEIITLLWLGLILTGFFVCCLISSTKRVSTINIIFIIGISIMYISTIIIYETIIKRIKAGKLWRTTLIGKILNLTKKFVENREYLTRLVIYYLGFCVLGYCLTLLLFISYRSTTKMYCILMLILLFIFTFRYLYKKTMQYKKVEETLKNIYAGNTNTKLEDKELTGILKNMAIYINDIASGFSNAVNEKLKSERLKTELITNVSHDIKTPLTSIINYVDLLKKEKMPNEKAQEYLMILENKSQRLKRLIEDLVEASKASSGNIKLNIEKINIKELINQVSGEFEEKFKEKSLIEVITIPEEDIIINADSRYMYRIFENIYSNISKYALENTRVYIDVKTSKNKVNIQIKNVSKEKLNITKEELMQRFVRGDSSRNTEGSGLGLSIASSLTKLQKGEFNIYLDGDLFKVILEFEKV